MNSLNTLFYPGTAIDSLRLYPIFLLFQNIHLLAPVEGDPDDSSKGPPDSFIKSRFCQVHTPCPLGPDRNRFLRLLEDIKNRQDDYAAQLSSLTLAAMTDIPSQEVESERAIARSLLPPTAMTPVAQEREAKESLWQARLVLAIGELLDHEEEEIALNMAVLEDEEKVLFRELQGEEDGEDEANPFSELIRMESALRGNSPSNVKKRFKAWKTLFLAGTMEECSIFLTCGNESSDILLEEYRQKTEKQAPLVANLELPEFVGWNSAEADNNVRSFTTKNTPFLVTLKERLQELISEKAIAGQDIKLAAPQLSLADAWEKLLDTAFPKNRYGRIPVSFYLFPDLSCSTLTGKVSTAASLGKNGLLAVIG